MRGDQSDCNLDLPSRREHDDFSDLADDGDDESHPDEEVELFIGRVCNQWFAADQNDGQSEEREQQDQAEHSGDRVDEARESRPELHLSDLLTPKAEAQSEGSVDCADCPVVLLVATNYCRVTMMPDLPSRTLLQVGGEVIGYSSELKGFVHIGSLPTLTKQQGRCLNVLSQSANRDVVNLGESFSANDVA